MIAVGLPDDDHGFVQWLAEVGASPDRTRIIGGVTLSVADVAKWVGVPSPADDMVRVKLAAPEPREGEEPHWLEFRPGEWQPSPDEPFCCWTSDLIAVRVEDDETEPNA